MVEIQKYDILFFPVVDCEFKNQKYNNLIFYMIEKGHRVFYFDFSNRYLKIKKTRDNLNVINLLDKFRKSIEYNNSNKELENYIENIIQKNSIKDCILFVEDSKWVLLVQYLKEKYNFKIIFKYRDYFVDEKILRISDLVIDKSKCLYEEIENSIKIIHRLVSIIIVTFNNLKYTRECINSIFEKTAYPNYEIIIVDNNSSDETPIYLKEIEKKYSNVTVILNEENYGFAKGNNIGIKKAKGDYIILLNNDTVVTRGWISGLIKHLERENNLGLVGPVTNYARNEARINVVYKNIKDMDRFAEMYTFINLNKLYKGINMLVMFCVAMKKELFDEIGYLDENFKFGMFEDDDFSYRVKKAGYEIACAKDVFIHHYGSISFKNLGSKRFFEIFEINKSIFEKKWNIKWNLNKW
ncbi:glycosyltransferase family 2 protein [Tepidibacter thalassicus]|uniref:Glycosyltransferase, GT2 family n=1 Tax=Tepidibacter thalassicus DSM 15285 TaxID=1123350 RepID=A0A1M5PF61_9FIRM|nr:glycosyltransferase family 2 protein [Tepidibacter thalassicus]SHH00357.1 Glycosyltransferase, GT2 family [Tepidibacter thalassicus DSM 15285]